MVGCSTIFKTQPSFTSLNMHFYMLSFSYLKQQHATVMGSLFQKCNMAAPPIKKMASILDHINNWNNLFLFLLSTCEYSLVKWRNGFFISTCDPQGALRRDSSLNSFAFVAGGHRSSSYNHLFKVLEALLMIRGSMRWNSISSMLISSHILPENLDLA